jgi:hypothetical protein
MRRRPSPDLTPATPEEIDRALGVTPEEIAAALALPEDDTPPQRFRYTGGARYLSAEYDGQTCFDAGPGRYRDRVACQKGGHEWAKSLGSGRVRKRPNVRRRRSSTQPGAWRPR